MNRNQRHRRMRAKRRECRLLFGVNRTYQLPPPRSGMGVQFFGERAMAMLDHLRGFGINDLIASASGRGIVPAVWKTVEEVEAMYPNWKRP